MKDKIRVGIAGATGYVGAELVRILSVHPGFSLEILASQSYAGQSFADVYPSFRGITGVVCSTPDPDSFAQTCDVVVTALPHGVSSELVPVLLGKGLRVLDHSGDFRYKDVSIYEQAYHLKHPCPELLPEAVYGLPELFRDGLADARLVSNPGCYPTCSILGLNPLLKHGLIQPSSIIIDAVSGVTGAGRKADIAYQFCETDSSFRAYSVTGHRHTSEIEQILAPIAGSDITVSFTPHLAPMKRGMLATIYADLKPGVGISALREAFEAEYGKEYFIRLLPPGEAPDTRNVAYTNFADISVFHDARTGRAVVLSAIDNLGKGAALQAVQSLNVMYGFEESTGLMMAGGGL
ncbi:MAG: N-acetyl-gamma-glutamyl-phosphate reductase [Saccharofermentanales bacterium]